MTFNEFWDAMISENPALRDCAANEAFLLTPAKLREGMSLAFEAGRLAGDDNGFERGLRAAEAWTTEMAMAEVCGELPPKHSNTPSLHFAGAGRRH